MKELLTQAERTLFDACEKNIASTVNGFRACGISLSTVNTQRLYRETHPTFEAYCGERWGLSRARAYQLMRAAEVAVELDQQGVTLTSEAQARELIAVPVAQRAEVVAAAAREGKVTAASIGEAARAVTQTETVKKSFTEPEAKLARSLDHALVEFLDMLSENHDAHDITKIEETVRQMFLEVESRVIASAPHMIPKVEAVCRKLLAKIEATRLEVAA